MNVALAILNYNGVRHLAELLPSATDAVGIFGRPCSIIVLDNRSTENDVLWLRDHHPEVEVVVAEKNDFLFSYNWLLANRGEDVIILLNNDLRLSGNFVSTLVRHFEDPEIFAVSSKAYDWDGRQVKSGPIMFHASRRGWIITGAHLNKQVLSYTLFASGGYMAVDRRKFLSLGGFDRLYYPAYGEDKDLCLRAWCRGWKVVYDPECYVYHREGGSWDQGNNQSQRLIEITNYLFLWRNFRSYRFRIAHLLYLQWLSLRKRVERDCSWLENLKEARRLWRERRAAALARTPLTVNVDILEKLCGAEIEEKECGSA